MPSGADPLKTTRIDNPQSWRGLAVVLELHSPTMTTALV